MERNGLIAKSFIFDMMSIIAIYIYCWWYCNNALCDSPLCLQPIVAFSVHMIDCTLKWRLYWCWHHSENSSLATLSFSISKGKRCFVKSMLAGNHLLIFTESGSWLNLCDGHVVLQMLYMLFTRASGKPVDWTQSKVRAAHILTIFTFFYLWNYSHITLR